MALPGLQIKDASRMTGIPDHTIRFLEKEFKDFLQPSRTNGGQRRYSDEDIAMLRRIRALLKDKEFTVQGARKYLESERDKKEVVHPAQLLDDSDIEQMLDDMMPTIRSKLKARVKSATEELMAVNPETAPKA